MDQLGKVSRDLGRGDRIPCLCRSFGYRRLGGWVGSDTSALHSGFSFAGGGLGFILHCDRLGSATLILHQSSTSSYTQLKLLLGLGCPVELLVDRDVARLKNDVGSSRIGVALENSSGPDGNLKKRSDLLSRTQC